MTSVEEVKYKTGNYPGDCQSVVFFDPRSENYLGSGEQSGAGLQERVPNGSPTTCDMRKAWPLDLKRPFLFPPRPASAV